MSGLIGLLGIINTLLNIACRSFVEVNKEE